MRGKFIVNSGDERELTEWIGRERPGTATNSIIYVIDSMSALTGYSAEIVKDAIRSGSLYAYDIGGYFTDADGRRGRKFLAASHVDTVMAWGDMKRLSVAAARQENAARLNEHRSFWTNPSSGSVGSWKERHANENQRQTQS